MDELENSVFRNRFKCLDAFKGIFILVIVFFHAGAAFNYAFDELEVLYTYGGTIGNIFFFMVSGFLISYVYKKKIRDDLYTLPHFLGRRLNKLYPTYIASMIIPICINGLPNLKVLTLNFLLMMTGWVEDYTAINSPCWFLSQLLLCYIIHFILIKVIKEEYYIYSLVLMVVWGAILLKMNLQVPFCYMHDGEGFRNYFMGCLVWELYSKCNEKNVNYKYIGYIGIGLWIGVFVGSSIFGLQKIAGDIDFVFGFLLIPSLFLVVLDWTWGKKILELHVLQRLGGLSIYIFFWHVPVMQVLLLYFGKINVIYSDKIKLGVYIVLLIVWCLCYQWILKRLDKVSLVRRWVRL